MTERIVYDSEFASSLIEDIDELEDTDLIPSPDIEERLQVLRNMLKEVTQPPKETYPFLGSYIQRPKRRLYNNNAS